MQSSRVETSPVQSSRVEVFGSINVDLVVRVPAIPRPGETVLAPDYTVGHGGKGANQAVAAARYGAADGLAVAMAGRVGADAFGMAARENLRANGVDDGGVATGNRPTGCAFITVDAKAENAITVASGANAELTAEPPDAERAAPGSTLVLQMEVPAAASLDRARAAGRAGARVIWNLAPVPPDLRADTLRAILSATAILVVNEGEAEAAARCLGHRPADALDAAALLAREGGTTCVVTRGRDGATAFAPDGTRHDAPARSVVPVDTTGAGDTFVGILAAEGALGSDLPAALVRAGAGAALACTVPGAQPGMPTRAAVLACLRPEASRDGIVVA